MDLEAGSVDVVILTALEVEYESVRKLLSGLQIHRHEQGTLFETGQLPGGAGTVALARTGPGNHRAAVLAERAISEFQPTALLFVGIAGGLHYRVKLGDVVVATKIYAYQGGREEDDGFDVRPVERPANHVLDETAYHVSLNMMGQVTPPADGQAQAPEIRFQAIASGEVVVNSRKSAVVMFLRDHYNDAVAIETEGAGVAEAAHLNGQPALIIRGISDYADGSKDETDNKGWRSTAAEHAAAFAIELATAIGTSPAMQRRRTSTRGGSRRWLLGVGVALLLMTGAMFWVTQASYASFYGELGMDTGPPPVGIGALVLATGKTAVLFTVVGAATFGAAVIGMAMVPGMAEQTGAAIPATAIAMVVGLVGSIAVSLLPFPFSGAVALLFPVVMLGALSRTMIRQQSLHEFAGMLVGVAAAVGVIGLGRWVGVQLGSLWWLIAALVVGGAAVLFGLVRWQAYELRRSASGQPDDTKPTDLLSQMNPFPVMRDVIRDTMSAGDARRTVAAVGLSVVIVAGLAVWNFVYLVGSASDAGAAAREYGYVPRDRVAITMSSPVRPATVTLHRRDVDPVGVCVTESRWAASLIAQDRDGSWVLLRPLPSGATSAEVVWLPAVDYSVRPVLDPEIDQGRPWLRAAC